MDLHRGWNRPRRDALGYGGIENRGAIAASQKGPGNSGGGPFHRMPKHSPFKSGNTMAGRRGVLFHGLFRAALDFDLRILRRPQTQRDTTNSSMATDEPLNTMRLRIIGSDILRRSSMLFQLPTN